MAAGAHLSKDFFDLIKSIGESKSKQASLLQRNAGYQAQGRCSPAALLNRPHVGHQSRSLAGGRSHRRS